MSWSKKIARHLPVVALLLAIAVPARAGLVLIPAPEVDLRDCDLSGNNHSKEVSSSDLISLCHDAVLANATGAANRWSTDSRLHVFGYHGMLFIDHLSTTAPTKHSVISGRNVIFKNVDAVAIDESVGEIFILDASTKTISVYSADEDGDVYPKRKLASNDLADAVSLAVDEQAGELLVLNSKANSLMVFERKASNDGRRPENATHLKRKIDLTGLVATGSTLTDIATSSQHSDGFVLDQGSGRIISFDRGSSRPSPKRSFVFAGVVDQAQYISYSRKDDAVRVMRSDGSGHEYLIGDRVPASN